MPAIGQHVMLRLRDDRVIAPDVVTQRLLARAVLKRAVHLNLLAFRAADTHLHLLLELDESIARLRVGHLQSALTQVLARGTGFTQARLKAIENQRHLDRTFFYILRQDTHHNFQHDPLHEASNIPDLLGMRVLDTTGRENVRRSLPRVRDKDILESVGWTSLGQGQISTIHPSLDGLKQAAAAAFGLPALTGRGNAQVKARIAASHLVARDHTTTEIAAALHVAPRNIRFYLQQDIARHWVTAVARQQKLRSAAAHQRPLQAAVDRKRP